MNDPTQQEPIVNRMIQLDPQDPTNYFALAKIREDAGRLREGRGGAAARPSRRGRTTRRSTCSSPGFYNRQEEFEKTIEALTQRAAIEPNNPEAFYTIVDLLLGQGLP